jgi:hypothetical protein
LTLKKEAFEVMVTGEKVDEYRSPSEWIKSRLYSKRTMQMYEYDAVKFTNGYGKDAPYFIREYLGFYFQYRKEETHVYSNGLTIVVKEGDIVIMLGEIIEKGNIKLRS